MAKIEITDEMVDRAISKTDLNKSPTNKWLRDQMKVALDAALNPPCAHKWHLTNTPYVSGDMLVRNYRCEKCDETKEDMSLHIPLKISPPTSPLVCAKCGSGHVELDRRFVNTRRKGDPK